MNFLRLADDLLSVLFEDDEIVAIDKPYGINSHTNESKAGQADFVQDGLIEIFEKKRGQKLYIVHRLDQTTTGVIIFAKTPEAAKKYAAYFFDRKVSKTYFFVTANKSTQDKYTIDQVIIHKAKELEAKTEFSLVQRNSDFELWQAHPLTGRNHQIRIHAKAAGISILGDDKYDGRSYPFICLHNGQIEFPNGILIKSKMPHYFEHLHILRNQLLAKTIFETDRRTRLFLKQNLQDQCYRLVHNKNDTKDFGFTIDQFGKNLILSCYNEKWHDSDQKTFTEFSEYMHKPIIVRLMYNRGKDPLNKSQFILCPHSEMLNLETAWVAKENEISYELRSDSGQSFGLFLDQRAQRNWVSKNSKGKSVLNLFSYTCGFSVAAALGEANEVVSVDTSKNVLNWGRRNFEINNLNASDYKFLNRDSLDFLQVCQKKNIKYDLIICDPPSFSRGEKGVFKIETSLEFLIQSCLSCLTEDGVLLFSTNYEHFFIDDIRRKILKIKDQLNLNFLEINNIQSGLDFELVGQKSILKSFLIMKKTSKSTDLKNTPTFVDEYIDEN